MTENEYIVITNKLKASMAISVLADVLPGNEYGVDLKNFRNIMAQLKSIESKLIDRCDDIDMVDA
jgi:hypothetical protein